MSWQSVLSSLGGAGGSLLSSAGEFFGNRYFQEKQNEFTKEMMQSRHQWEVEDLRKAGLNPILSAGSAPSMGSSAMASMSKPENPITAGLSAAASAAQLKAIRAESAARAASSVNKETIEEIKGDVLQKYPWVGYLMAFPKAASLGTGALAGASALGLRSLLGKMGAKGGVANAERYGGKLFVPAKSEYIKGGTKRFTTVAKSARRMAWLSALFNPYMLSMMSSAAGSAALAKKWKLNNKKIRYPKGGLYNKTGGY